MVVMDRVQTGETAGVHASSEREQARESRRRKKSMPKVGRFIGAMFLCLGPIVYFLAIWPNFLHGLALRWPFADGDEAYGQICAVLSIVYWSSTRELSSIRRLEN